MSSGSFGANAPFAILDCTADPIVTGATCAGIRAGNLFSRNIGGLSCSDQHSLALQLGLAALFPCALHQLALAMAQLLGEAVGHDVDRLVKIMAVVLGMNIRPWQREVHLDHKGMLECAFVVVPQRHVRSDQVQSKMFQTFDLLGHVSVYCRSQLNIAGADVNLHN